jgi:hypothetical protein
MKNRFLASFCPSTLAPLPRVFGYLWEIFSWLNQDKY